MFRLTQWRTFGTTGFDAWREQLTAQGIAWELRRRGANVALFRDGQELVGDERRKAGETWQEADSVVIRCSGKGNP